MLETNKPIFKSVTKIEKNRDWEKGSIEALGSEHKEGGRGLESYEEHFGVNRMELANKTILDLGSGTKARLATELKNSNIQASVISLSPDYSEKKYREDLVDKKINESNILVSAVSQELPFKESTFDIIFALHLLEYICDSKEKLFETFYEITRILKVDGKAYLAPTFWEESVTKKFLERVMVDNTDFNFSYTIEDLPEGHNFNIYTFEQKQKIRQQRIIIERLS